MTNWACGRLKRSQGDFNVTSLLLRVTLTLVCLLLLKSMYWLLLCQLDLVGNCISFPLWFQARVEQNRNLYKVWKAEVKRRPWLRSEGHCGQMRRQAQSYLVAFSSSSSSPSRPAALRLPPRPWTPRGSSLGEVVVPRGPLHAPPLCERAWRLQVLHISDVPWRTPRLSLPQLLPELS